MSERPYILIDTNIFIQCCLLELEKGDDLSVLEKLNTLLQEDKLYILLPEVVELEFHSRLNKKIESMKRYIADYKKQIGKDSNLDERVKSDMIEKIGECLEERERNTEIVKTEIEKVFKSSNTIRLSITPEDIVNAFRCSLREDKPFNSSLGINIQSDVLIVEAAKKYFSNREKYSFYICSNNKADFAEVIEKEGKKVSIATEIKKEFDHIEYYPNLLQLLNDKFKAGYEQEDIKNFSEVDAKEPLVINVPDGTGPEFISKLSAILKECEVGSRKVAVKVLGATIRTRFLIQDDENSLSVLKANILRALEESKRNSVQDTEEPPF